MTVLVIFVLPCSSSATTRVVPDDLPTIQSAVDASSNNDSVLVRPGTYFENINFHMKDVTVRSISGPELTIIDGSQPVYPDTSSVIYLRGVGESARVEGFTLQHGHGTATPLFGLTGGGVSVIDSNGEGPTIAGNLVTQNHATVGGGVYLAGSCNIVGNLISDNTAGQGAGLASRYIPISNFPQVITGNEIFENRCLGSDYDGGGVSINSLFAVVLAENIIACNEAEKAGGIMIASSPSGLTVERNTIFANWGRSGVGGARFVLGNQMPLVFRGNILALNLGGGLECLVHPGGTLIAECNDFFGNNPDLTNDECGLIFGQDGNVRLDPLFGAAAGCPPAPGDLCLSATSPLLPENSPPGCELIGARGLCTPDGVVDASLVPRSLSAQVPRPNPFTDRTSITFFLPERAHVALAIYGVTGRCVRMIDLGDLGAGTHDAGWDGRVTAGRRAVPGAYLARIKAGPHEVARTLLLVR